MARVEIADISRADDMEAAFDIRREVFCREQGVSEEEELDGLDSQCRHYLARCDGAPVATARTRMLASGEAKVERVAVRRVWRGRGVGQALMSRVIADLGPVPIVLNAQLRTVGFYAGLGFVPEGPVFSEAGIDHLRMTLAPDADPG